MHFLPNASGYLITVNTKAAITMDSNKWAKADWNTGTTYLVSTTTYGTGHITDIARIARRLYVTVNEETGKIDLMLVVEWDEFSNDEIDTAIGINGETFFLPIEIEVKQHI